MGFNNPCCWCTIRTGTKIIATINSVGALMAILMGIIIFAQVQSVADMVKTYLDHQMKHIYYEDDFYLYNKYTKKAGRNIDQDVANILVMVIACVLIISGIALLVLASLLYTGAQKGNVVMCKIWLIVYGSCTFLGGLASAIQTTRNPSNAKLISLLIGLIINVYFMWVVNAFIKQLRKEKNNRLAGNMYAMQS